MWILDFIVLLWHFAEFIIEVLAVIVICEIDNVIMTKSGSWLERLAFRLAETMLFKMHELSDDLLKFQFTDMSKDIATKSSEYYCTLQQMKNW